MGTLKGYILVIAGGVVLLVAGVFVMLQWGSRTQFSLFGPAKQVSTFTYTLASAVAGVVVYWMARSLLRGAAILRRARRERGKAAPPRDEGT